MRRLQILRGQLQYKPELKDGEFFLDKTNHSLLIGDASVADGQFELAKQSAITNLQQQVDTKITAAQAPVQSVNTKTGAVVLTATDVGALPDTTSIPTKTSELTNDSNFVDTTTLNNSLATKQNTITGGASTITDDNLTVSRALVSDSSGKVAVSDITATELGYLDGVTSNIQTQIDTNKIPDNDVILKQEAKTSNITSNIIWYIAYNNTENKFVTLGYDNSTGDRKAAYSNDGFNWTTKDLSVSQSILLTAIAYGNNTFVAIGAGTSAAYSTDGINWSLATTLSYGSRWSIAFGNNKFVTVSVDSQTATYSTDGINWADSTLPISAKWASVTYGNGKFVAVARETNKAAYSTDGITWTAATMPSSGWWSSVTYGNGKFVATGLSGVAAYSIDGINWIGTNVPNYDFGLVIYGNTNFVAYTSYGNKAIHSADGINWTEISLPINTDYINSASYTDNKFIAISQLGKMLYSTDGITWADTISTNALVNPSNVDITESVYNTLSPYIPAPTVPTKTSELTNDSGYITQTAGDGRYLKLSGSGDIQVSNYDSINFNLMKGFALQGLEIGSYIASGQDGTIKIGVSDNEAFKCDNETTYVTSKQAKGVHISNLADPTANTDAVNKSYVDTKAANYLPLAGGNVTGTVSFGSGLTTIDGVSGSINMQNLAETTTARLLTQDKTFIISNSNGNVSIQNLRNPTLDTEATSKSYVDQYAPHATLVTLTVAGWNSTAKTQTVTVSGILADESKQLIIPMPATASMTAYNDAGIQCTGQAANSLTFTAETVPTAAISVYVTYQTVIS